MELEAALLTINNNTDTSYNSSNTDTVVASLHRVLVSASFQTTSLYWFHFLFIRYFFCSTWVGRQQSGWRRDALSCCIAGTRACHMRAKLERLTRCWSSRTSSRRIQPIWIRYLSSNFFVSAGKLIDMLVCVCVCLSLFLSLSLCLSLCLLFHPYSERYGGLGIFWHQYFLRCLMLKLSRCSCMVQKFGVCGESSHICPQKNF